MSTHSLILHMCNCLCIMYLYLCVCGLFLSLLRLVLPFFFPLLAKLESECKHVCVLLN